MDRVEGKLKAVRDAELVENIVEVILYSLLRDEKLFADFLVAETLGDELDDFFFPVAEKRLFATGAGLGRFGEGFHDLCGHAIVEPDFAGMDAVNGLDEQVGGGLLQDYAASAEPHGAYDVTVVFGGGEHDHAGGQGVKVDFLEDGKTVFIGHAEVEEKNIGLELGEHLDAFGAILGFADDGDVFIGIEEFAETIAENGVVIGEEHTNLLFRSFSHDLAERNFDGKARTMTGIGLHGQHAPHGTRTLLDGNGTQPQTVQFIPGELAREAEALAVVVHH